ncbi:glycosyltransferase family 2 protein [Thioclava sp. JE_KL1]|uniref:glycosyltransferase family 2 protein n=1 Tax=Thioclava sp. JE_KL1 TaxID=2651187 RepID=UPI00128AEC93|nr:glycosyltransferase family 2 protein [Thioclava sp. JE_KL1]MPQ94108.1 glycosyltransferase family 2 protein [Thioclava sp. JE_KL1]
MGKQRVIRRRMQAQTGKPALLDAVGWTEETDLGPRHHLRAFFAAPSQAEDLSFDAVAGAAHLAEGRNVAGAVMAIYEPTEPGPIQAAMSGPDGPSLREITPASPDWEMFEGRNCLFGLRLEESVETVLDWLSWHHDHHGATGAVIVNRAPVDSPAGTGESFADALEAGMALRELDLPVAILESPLPLGKLDQGPENHVFLAPDAPGKDRMEPPAPDPQRSPLGQALIFEIAKWRFFAKAASVLVLDVTDLLAAREPGQPSAFEATQAAENGVILLVGRRIYPWRVRNDQPARFPDHICRQFDARRGIARWGCAPQKAGLENTWRLLRVSYCRPDPGLTYGFWRAMALRVPGTSPAELAPKTSLVEDERLLHLSRDIWGFKPVRPPVSKVKDAPAQAVEAGRTAIVTTMKNEGPFILEWIAYHRAIGVDDFLVYTNDCTDGTDTMLDLLQAKGYVQHRENPFRTMVDMKPQHAALAAAENEPVITKAGWSICMDVDEFINVKIGDGTLKSLYEAMGEANMIALTWRLFGNADVHAFEDSFITGQFTRCAPEIVRKPHQAWGFKTLFRNIALYKKLGVHRPKGLNPDLWDQVNWLNGSGQPMPREMFRNGWRSTLDTYGYDWVQLNHYAVRSAESFLVKRDRGRVNHVDRDQGLNYWFRMNHNAVEDRSIQRMLPAARAEFDRMMADPEIAAAHNHAAACHRAKIEELMARPDQREFYETLTSERFEALSRMLHVFGSAVFNTGPHVIPDDLHARDLPHDFFFTVDAPDEATH